MSNKSFAQMRLRNAESILQVVRFNQEVSRAEVARDTGLAPATVSSIVDDLIKMQFLTETGSRSTALGRRPIGLAFNPASVHFAGLSISDRRHLCLGLVDLDAKLCCQESMTLSGQETAVEVTDAILKLLRLACRNVSVSTQSVAALALALPGPLHKGAVGAKESEIDFYKSLTAVLDKRLEYRVYMDTLVNMAAIAESYRIPGPDSVVYVRAGHALRASVVIEGKVLSGKNSLAGEIGHLSLPGKDWYCFCGKNGCLNSAAALPCFIERCQAAGLELKIASEFAAVESEPGFDLLLNDCAEALAFAVAVYINSMAPETVIVSAPYFSIGELFKQKFSSAVAAFVQKELLLQTKLVLRDANEGTEAIGAAICSLKQFSLFDYLKNRIKEPD